MLECIFDACKVKSGAEWYIYTLNPLKSEFAVVIFIH